jgi:DNA-binding transcriptional ArsR family regulator
MPFEMTRPGPLLVGPSAVSELTWLAHLVARRANYCEPALRELEQILPGIGASSESMTQAYGRLWPDALSGAAELLVIAHEGGQLLTTDLAPFLDGLEEHCSKAIDIGPLRSESDADRAAIAARLARLRKDAKLRRAYRLWLADVWQLASPTWEAGGREAAIAAATELEQRITAGSRIRGLLSPRHPAVGSLRADSGEPEFEGTPVALSPLYFCLSGGHFLELPGLVHLGLPGSGLAPGRKFLDAGQVASLLKVLTEPARVTVLIHLLTDSGGVMDVARKLGMSQPVVSGHLKQLREAGLVSAWSDGPRNVYSTDLARVEKVLDDARSLLSQWGRQRG